jgi:hypothetical protein
MPPSSTIAPEFYRWLLNSPWAYFLNNHEWAFPVVQSLHFIGFALLVGTIAIVDMQLLGFGTLRQTPAKLAADLAPWTAAGIAVMLTTGPLMFSADAPNYYFNPALRFKMVFLIVALLFHFTLHRRAVRPDVSPMAAKLAATTSLLLWITVVAGGRMIAFI